MFQWMDMARGDEWLENVNVHYNSAGPHFHTLTKTAAKAATCTETGNKDYWTCSDCGKIYSDARGNQETTLTAMTIPALGHSYKNGVCTQCGKKDPKGGRTRSAFIDVASSAWYAENVAFVAEKGLMVGVGNNVFDPKGTVTVAQAITMAARIHSQYTTGKESFGQSSGGAWYQPYVDYAKKNRIIDDQYDKLLNKKATRAQFADIFSKALPDKGLKKINTVPDRAIPDVSMKDSYAEGVYKLYRAGILSGNNSKGTFAPLSTITRAEAAAIVARMADEGQRVKVTLTAPGAASGHRYEFVISDASWTQAQRTAKAAGGYLAQIETREEYLDLIDQLNAAGMQKVEFRIGAQRKTGTNDFYWVDASGTLTGPILNSEAFWGYDEWLDGEPSLNWGGNLETVIEIYYDAKLNKWVWNDIWDTVTAPNVGSHYGYIIEYDR